MIGFYAVGMLSPSIWIVYAMLLGALPLLARTRAEAAALFIVATGAVPELVYPLQIGSLYLVAVDKWILLSIGLMAAVLFRRRAGPKAGMRFSLPYVIMLALDLYVSRDDTVTATLRNVVGVLLAGGVGYFAFTNAISRIEDLRRVLLAFAYIGFVLSCVAVVEGFLHTLFYATMSAKLNIGGTPLYRLMKFRGGILRATTVYGDATTLAQFLVVTLMATVTFRHNFRTTRALGIALGVITVGIFVTSTRNAWIGVLVGVMAFDLYRGRFLPLVGKVTLLGMMYGSVLLLAEFIPYFNAMVNGPDTTGTANYRSLLLTRGMEEYHKHPLSGIAVKKLLIDMKDLVQGEGIVDFVNGYLFYALADGLLGFIGLLLVFLLPCVAMLAIRRSMIARGLLLERSAALVFSVCLTYAVMTAFTGYGGHYEIPLYCIMGLGAVLFSWRRVAPARLNLGAANAAPPLATLGPPAVAKPLIAVP
ncbi:hypothetical protein FHS31_002221 [Sphingomonas vulcanisoli]|uniref:O-antigen ligase domain-containing protein n=1 Tax=Sphingomonas vulcanisoli TaxID=1658060 RepID=A0ABX0TVX7_9SPHN|nr:O-antigen ligase family protein [Sphingomonas vulcanisoli]NIJ08600.1 hypothetical protein [Sphingomonas vulcanisoli]